MASTTVTMRIDEETKTQLQELTAKLGMDVSTYLLLAVKQGIREQALPFRPSLEKNVNLKKEEAFASMERIVENKKILNSNIDYDIDKKEAYLRLEQLRVKGTVTDYKAELESYRDEKYDK